MKQQCSAALFWKHLSRVWQGGELFDRVTHVKRFTELDASTPETSGEMWSLLVICLHFKMFQRDCNARDTTHALNCQFSLCNSTNLTFPDRRISPSSWIPLLGVCSCKFGREAADAVEQMLLALNYIHSHGLWLKWVAVEGRLLCWQVNEFVKGIEEACCGADSLVQGFSMLLAPPDLQWRL